MDKNDLNDFSNMTENERAEWRMTIFLLGVSVAVFFGCGLFAVWLFW